MVPAKYPSALAGGHLLIGSPSIKFVDSLPPEIYLVIIWIPHNLYCHSSASVYLNISLQFLKKAT